MHGSLSIALVGAALAVFGCGKNPSPSPTNPSPPPVAAIVHDTLNPAGAGSNLGATSSERWGGYDRQVYDDFVAPAAATIGTVAWQGMRVTTSAPVRFYVLFIADAGGSPLLRPDEGNTGRPRALYDAVFSVSEVNERLDVTQPCENSPLQQCGLYDYSVTLPTPFRSAAGGRYWLMIQAESSFDSPSAWSWRNGRPDNGRSSSNIAGTTFTWDLAFALRP